MAEQVVNSVSLVVTGELTSRVFSGLIERYGKDAATREKLQRLEMLLIKIHSAIEASEKHAIENLWMLRWHDKLKDAVSRGDEVLARFRQLGKDSQASSNVDVNRQNGEAAFSSTASPATAVGALSLPKKSMSGIVQRIRSARMMLFASGDDDMERLNKILARLEKLSPDIGEFIRLLHLEVLPKVVQARVVYLNSILSTKVHGVTKKMGKMREKKRMRHSSSSGCSLFGLQLSEEKMKEMSAQSIEEEKSDHFVEACLQEEEEDYCFHEDLCFRDACLKEEEEKYHVVEACLQEEEEEQGSLLQDRLEAAFNEICKAIELASCDDLEGLQWLAYWGGILREAKEQYYAILDTISVCKTVNAEDEELMVRGDRERDELSSFVHRQEGLARDVEYFKKLVYLCPAC